MSLRDDMADLFLAGQCPGCGSPGWGVCRSCVRTIGSGVIGARSRSIISMPLWSGGDYVDPVRRVISHVKDHGRWDCLPLLSRRLAFAVAGLVDECHLVGAGALVPVPSMASAVRERGLDVVAQMAKRCVSLLTMVGMDVQMRGSLRLTARSSDQGGLSTPDRLANLAGKMSAGPVDESLWVIIVDDVVTTGASIVEATRALTQEGHRVVGAATIAATVLRNAQ